jgi:hypothetical protein
VLLITAKPWISNALLWSDPYPCGSSRPEGELSELQGSITALGQYQTIAEYVNPKTLHGVAMCDFFGQPKNLEYVAQSG